MSDKPLELNAKLNETKTAWIKGNATLDDVYAAADAYIASVKAYCKSVGKKAPNISRHGLLR